MYAIGRLALLGLVVCVASFSVGQEHKGVLYKTPAGWNEAPEGEAKVFAPKDLKEGEVVAVIVTPAVAVTAETPAKQFETVVASANTDNKVLARGEVESKSADGSTVCIQAFQLESADLGKHSRIYAMIFSAKQRTLVMVILKPDSVTSKYESDIMSLIGSIKLKEAGKEAPATTKPKPVGNKTPTGNTPDLFPGMPGWLPSGKGTAIPVADIVNGKPQGLWWTMSYGDGKKAMTFVFLPNGIHASNPRYGGGTLVDIEGQKAQVGANGVGPFSISGGQITLQHDGFSSTDPYTTGTDSSGRFFKVGEATYRPLLAPTKQSLVGTWRFPGNKYVFSMNGTYEAGQTVDGGDWVATSVVSGTYSIDGHLVTLRPKDGPMTIMPMGMVGKEIMLASGLLFKKS